ncbi:MAG: amino acid ABC transporter substrate-binding protein [Elainella sp. C42_A2020_010]|nr:amino acid ABC transporter substrate-binding protein [Elainella sp. C42_A2020_010]
MSSRNSRESFLLAISLLITVGILGILWFWLSPRLTSQVAQLEGEQSSASSSLNVALANRFSLGERQLINDVDTLAKREGIAAFAAAEYQMAVQWFEESLQLKPNDPETLIYLNNARLRAAQRPTYRIATSVPIGKAVNVAQEILRGVAQSQDEINRSGGINNVGLEVEIIDDSNDPNLTRQIATVLVNDQDVLAVVGHNTSDASLGAAPIYQEHGLVMISPTTFNPAVAKVGNYIFRAVPTAQSIAAALVEHLTEQLSEQLSQPAKMLICYDATAPDNAVFRDAFVDTLTANGGEVVKATNKQGDDLCNFASRAFDPEQAIARAIEQGANSLYLGPSINNLAPAIEVARANDRQLALFGSPSLYTQKITQDGQQAVEGLVLVAPWSPDAYPDFAQRAQRLWRATVNWRTATAYDATRAVIAGLQQGKTRRELQRALQNPDFSTSGAGDSVRFLDTRDRRLTPVLIQVQSNGSGEYRFRSASAPVPPVPPVPPVQSP